MILVHALFYVRQTHVWNLLCANIFDRYRTYRDLIMLWNTRVRVMMRNHLLWQKTNDASLCRGVLIYVFGIIKYYYYSHCYPSCEFTWVTWSLSTETAHVHTRFSWWIGGSIGRYFMEVSAGLLYWFPHNIVQTSVVIRGVLGSLHLDCSQWSGGGGNMSDLELPRDALVCFIRGVDPPLILACVILGLCSILTTRARARARVCVEGGCILSVPGSMQL